MVIYLATLGSSRSRIQDGPAKVLMYRPSNWSRLLDSTIGGSSAMPLGPFIVHKVAKRAVRCIKNDILLGRLWGLVEVGPKINKKEG